MGSPLASSICRVVATWSLSACLTGSKDSGLVVEIEPAGLNSFDNQGLARLQSASPPCQGDDHPGSIVASFRSLLGGPVEWISDLNFLGGMKLSALFQFLADRLGQPVVLVPGGDNGDTPIQRFTLLSCFNIGSSGLPQVIAFGFMDTAQLIQPFKPLGDIPSGHQPDGLVVVGRHLAADVLQLRTS